MAASSTKTTAVMKGVSFETRAVGVLRQHLSMSLRRVGGRGDGGIDLQGWWWLPSKCLRHTLASGARTGGATPDSHMAVRVLVQCKAEEKKIGPHFIREFEGTILRNSAYFMANAADAGHEGQKHAISALAGSREPVVGLFASLSPFTKASLLQAYSSPIPLALLHLPASADPIGAAAPALCSTHQGTASEVQADFPGTLVFNQALCGANGLLRGKVEPRWERSTQGLQGRPGLWLDGRRMESWIPEEDTGAPRET